MPHRTTLTPIRLGVIGPADLVGRIQVLAAGIPALDVVERSYESEESASELLKALMYETDAVLFTGPVPYHLALAAVEPVVPVLHVPLKGNGLYRTLYHAREQVDLQRVSVDTLTQSEVVETYSELGLLPGGVHCLEGYGSLNREAILEFHLNHYRQGRSSAALTGLLSAHQELQRAGVPSFWITPTTADLRSALDRALLLSSRSRLGQVVVGIIRFSEELPGGTEYEHQQVWYEIHGCLLRFVEQFDGYLIASGINEHQFVATREPFERSTGALAQTSILEEVHRLSRGQVSMGVGIGRTANQAGTHARIALRRAQGTPGNACFVVLPNRRLVGPLGTKGAVASDLRTLDPHLQAAARAIGMSAPSLDRLTALLRTEQSFTAADVADIVDLSLRSAHRIVARLEQLGAIAMVGQEKLVGAGRPRQVYRWILRNWDELQLPAARPGG